MARRLVGPEHLTILLNAKLTAEAAGPHGQRLSEAGIVLDIAPDLVEKVA